MERAQQGCPLTVLCWEGLEQREVPLFSVLSLQLQARYISYAPEVISGGQSTSLGLVWMGVVYTETFVCSSGVVEVHQGCSPSKGQMPKCLKLQEVCWSQWEWPWHVPSGLTGHLKESLSDQLFIWRLTPRWRLFGQEKGQTLCEIGKGGEV